MPNLKADGGALRDLIPELLGRDQLRPGNNESPQAYIWDKQPIGLPVRYLETGCLKVN